MKTKRRDFLKHIGIGSGALLAGPVVSFNTNAANRTQDQPDDEAAFTKKKYKTDVVVAGGGMAGICAAIAAARNGAKVLLIQDRSRLGGNASSEIRMHISGATTLKQVWRETGILEELFLTNSVENPQRSYEFWDFILYNKVISEKNITLLLDTVVFDAEVRDGEIVKIKTLCAPTQEIAEISAKMYADCTGDATLAAAARAAYMVGREARSQWGESLAVEVADLRTMGNSILFMAQEHKKKMPYTPPVWARKYTAKDFVHRRILSIEYGYWWLELGGMGDTIKDGQQNRHELLAALFGVWDYIKNSGDHPESANWALSWLGMLPGKRESRRITGEYVLKQDDIQHPKLFPDRVSYGGWPMDDHPPEGMDGTAMQPTRAIYLKEPYSIPLRSLYSKNIKNLMMAGRNLSASHIALSSTRVMATCAAMGQAVGTAMGYCINQQVMPTVLGNGSKHMVRLQQILLRQDQPLLGVRNDDQNDLARQAKVRASSETTAGPAISVTDGVNRNIMDGQTHQWQARMIGGKPWLLLKWEKPVRFNRVELVFDTGLNRFLRISGQDVVQQDQIVGPQPETVANYTIAAGTNNKLLPIADVKDNYLRKVVHTFKPIEADTLQLSVLKTNGDALARVFEIRCYLE